MRGRSFGVPPQRSWGHRRAWGRAAQAVPLSSLAVTPVLQLRPRLFLFLQLPLLLLVTVLILELLLGVLFQPVAANSEARRQAGCSRLRRLRLRAFLVLQDGLCAQLRRMAFR